MPQRQSPYVSESTPSPNQSSFAGEIMNELVKSYGFRRDDKTGQWDWSVGNIQKSFEEDPVWTTIDYLTLAVPATKWGTAAYKVGKAGRAGAGAIKSGRGSFALRAHQAGEISAREARSLVVRSPRQNLRKLPVIGEKLQDMSTVRLASGMTRKEIDLMSKYGDPEDLRAVKEVYSRELNIQNAASERLKQDIVRDLGKQQLDDSQKLAMVQAFESGSPIKESAIYQTFGKFGKRAMENLDEFRMNLHEASYEYGLITRESYIKNNQKYWPHIAKAQMEAEQGIRGGKSAAKAGESRFMRRTKDITADHEDFKDLFDIDPIVGIDKLAQAATTLNKQKYIVNLAKTPLVKSREELADAMLQAGGTIDNVVMKGREGLIQEAEKQGWTKFADALVGKGVSRQLKSKSSFIKKYKAEIGWRQSVMDDVFAFESGQKSLEELSVTARGAITRLNKEFGEEFNAYSDKLGEEISKFHGKLGKAQKQANKMKEGLPPGLANLPDDILDKYVDPAALESLRGAAKVEKGTLGKIYYTMQAGFKASKTKYNPATHSRNFLANQVFYSLTTNRAPFLLKWPGRGIKSLLEQDETYKKAVNSGVLDSSFDEEILNLLREAYGSETSQSGLTGIMRKFTTKNSIIDKAISKMENADEFLGRLYQAEDQVYKLEALQELTEKFGKSMNADEAFERAVLEVNRFMPNYSDMNPLLNEVRKHVPFISFPIEGARVWKNAMIHKPHLAYGWNHSVELMSHTFGAMSGMSGEEIQAGRESLPFYTQDKKMMLLPFRDSDDKPYFLDLSYLMPMADMGAEAQAQENLFFGLPLGPVAEPFKMAATSNPLMNLSAAIGTGTDPFSGRETSPRMLEGLPGADEPGAMRNLVGLGEHMMRTMLPPLVPPGYAGANLIEAAKGTKDSFTGEELEEGMLRTALGNVAGLRAYEPTAKAQLTNARRKEKKAQEAINLQWRKFESAMANNNPTEAAEAQNRIIQLREGHRGDGVTYFDENAPKHMPGKYRTTWTRHLEEAVERGRTAGLPQRELSPLTSALAERQQGRPGRSRGRRRSRPTRGR